ncbi:MAG: hypothetical protein ACFB14_12720 [Leptolyngbyaceae cyanobacterium]
MIAGGPYRELWEYYRYLDDPDGRPLVSNPQQQPIDKLKQAIGQLARRIKK